MMNFFYEKCTVLRKYLPTTFYPFSGGVERWATLTSIFNVHYLVNGCFAHLIWFFLRCGLAPRCFEVKEADPPGSVTFYREKCIRPHEKLIFLLKTTDQSYLQNT